MQQQQQGEALLLNDAQFSASQLEGSQFNEGSGLVDSAVVREGLSDMQETVGRVTSGIGQAVEVGSAVVLLGLHEAVVGQW